MDYTTTWENEIQMSRAEEKGAETVVSAEKTDAQLVALVLAGDEAAFENLFDRYKRLVASIGSRYFRRHEEIDEIIQISFSRVYFQLRYFRGGHDASFAGWISKIATNACLDTVRNQIRKPENLLCELSEPETEILLGDAMNNGKSAESSLVERDLAEKLLSHLKKEDRAILQMLDAEEMTVAEVAEITGWSKAKIKIRAFRARHALRKVLGKFL
ncbi:MAG TPA: sigma-70 family RNA polymerase sigma factor [Pyrinomonadaceae bacterium]|nr:sigma-70 family RNA polymerase sigma factor [Pyrinomonadaceae bacterium]